MYKIAEKNGVLGKDAEAIEARVYLGLMEGYDGPVHTLDEVMDLVQETREQGLPLHVTFSYRLEKVRYTHDEQKITEDMAVLTATSNPFFQRSDAQKEEWKGWVEAWAKALAKKLNQSSFRIVFSTVDNTIYWRQNQ